MKLSNDSYKRKEVGIQNNCMISTKTVRQCCKTNALKLYKISDILYIDRTSWSLKTDVTGTEGKSV